MLDSEIIIAEIQAAWAAGTVPGYRDRAIVAACAAYRFPQANPNWRAIADAALVSERLAPRFCAVGSGILRRERLQLRAWLNGVQTERFRAKVRGLREGVLRRSSTADKFMAATRWLAKLEGKAA